MAIETPPQPGQLPSSPVVQGRAMGTNHRTARIVAIIAGLLGAALALATPFLPVNQTTAQLNWPQNGVLQSVNAPLIGYVATDLTISVPCRGGRRPCRAAERRQDRVAVYGAQAGAQGRRPRPADRTGQQRPARHRPQHPGGQRAAEPGAQPGMREADVHRAAPTRSPASSSGWFRGPTPTIPASPCAASAAATTSGPKSSACSPIWPGPRRRACSSRPPWTRATAHPRRC